MRPVIVNDAPQVRPWRATAADKASSARTRLELHERSSSQPVRAKKPPPPSAHPRHAPARVDRRGRPSAPPPLRRARRARAAAAAAAAPSRLLATAAALPRATTLSPSPDAPGADGTPAKAEQRPRRGRCSGRCSAPPPIRVSPDAAPSATPSPDTGHWWRCTSASPPSPPAPRPRSAAGAAPAAAAAPSQALLLRLRRIPGGKDRWRTKYASLDSARGYGAYRTRGARAVQPCHRLSRLGARRFVWVHTVAGGGARGYFSRCSCR